jgi:hypothetical protein
MPPEVDFVVATLGEELGKTKRFCDKIEAAEKGAASMTREFRSTKIAVWINLEVLEMVCE